MDRIVGISSIIIQRLLDPMVIPLDGASEQNPFVFNLPTLNSDFLKEANENEQSNIQNNVNECSPKALTDEPDMKIFNKFDSDLDDDDDDDDHDNEDSDDEDSFLNPVSNNVQSDKNLFDFSTNQFSAENDEEKLLESYLRFFPELKHLFNLDNTTSTNGVLACQCDTNLEQFISRNNLTNCIINSNRSKFSVSFDWPKMYESLSKSTLSVIPIHSLALPELNFINSLNERNELPQPLTYPFLDKVVRRKNYHHIKVLDHIRERFNNKNKFIYKVVYDNENWKQYNNHAYLGDYLQFDSKFESGNLRKVLVKQRNFNVEENEKNDEKLEPEEEYLLLLNSDVNSSFHTQWFYYSVRRMKSNRRYRFKIINIQKKSILYNSGQQPLFYSEIDYRQSHKQWQRIGASDHNKHWRTVVSYYRNHYVHANTVASLFTDRPYYTLEFTFVFPHQDDVCYFAYNIPLSYTFLKTNLYYWTSLVQQHNNNLNNKEDGQPIYYQTQTLCTTLKGNDLPLMTITSNDTHHSKPHYILLTARVHPSESNSSWILKGFIDFLLHESVDEANERLRRKLLQNYVFKIVPMLNPDGVINGW